MRNMLLFEMSLAFWGGLSQAPGLTLGFQEGKDVILTDGANNVADDAAVGVVQELHTHLGHSSTAASAAEHLEHLSLLDGSLLCFHYYAEIGRAHV